MLRTEGLLDLPADDDVDPRVDDVEVDGEPGDRYVLPILERHLVRVLKAEFVLGDVKRGGRALVRVA